MEPSRPELTYQQRDILLNFRSNVEDILTSYHTDDVLLKYLRAKDFDLKKAEDNFRLVDSTRKLYFIDTYPLANFVINEVIKKYRIDSLLGNAKDGTLIRYIKANGDFGGFLHAVSCYDLLLFFCHTGESDLKLVRENNAKTGRNDSDVTYIFDLDGFSFQELAHKYIIESGLNFLCLLQDFYPEIWRIILFINVPYIFDKLYMLFKPVLKESLVRKMKIANRSSSVELLRTYIDDDVLPAFLGGKRVDSKGDPYCKEFINQAGKIPEKFYLKNCSQLIGVNDSNVKTAMIRPRSVFNVPLIIKKARTKFRLEFRTENGSIIHFILYRDIVSELGDLDLPEEDEILDPNDKNSNVKIVSTRVRVQSQLAPNTVDCIAINRGIYIIQFDNMDSWFGSRKLFYRITMSS